MKTILLVTPPMIQLNTPYPATPYLTGFLRSRPELAGVHIVQADPALQLFLRAFSASGLREVREVCLALAEPTPVVAHFLSEADAYIDTIDAVIRFLQGRDPTLAFRIATRAMLPEGPRFATLQQEDAEELLHWGFGSLGIHDRAKHLASLYIDDLADVMREGVDPRFGLSRYAESLAAAAPSFAPLAEALQGTPTLIDGWLDDISRELVQTHAPDLLGVTVPFPGNLYGGLRLAQAMRQARPGLRVVMGGGYVNTELRALAEPQVFDYVDYVTLDDGEAPLLALLAHLQDPAVPLKRTFVRNADEVVWCDAPGPEVPMAAQGTPTYAGLPLPDYVALLEMLNPVHRLWSEGRWNKLTIAHGCYWRKCTFCDIHLDYIQRYEPVAIDTLVARIEALVAETGQTGFHFVDEAAPPSALRALSERLLARGLRISWWGNVRFEKAFTPELCELMAQAGCIAISGGLEAASDRLLKLMNKGVTVAQVARVTKAFADAGIMVHAYLMYGFPTQTAQETIDSLERVRQLFDAGCLHSAFWHRFAATVHSPVGKQPELFQISLRPMAANAFARNDVGFVDPTPCDHETLGQGLRAALYNYMQGVGLERDVRQWFGKTRVPAPQVAPTLIRDVLAATQG